MKPVKAFGLLAIAVLAAMSLAGTSSAAASTALCRVDEDPCSVANRVTKVHLVAETVLIHTSAMDYECSGLLSAEVGEPGKPQTLTAQSLVYSNCNQGCTRTVEKLGQFSVERIEEEKAIITGNEFQIHVKCGSTIDCYYAFNELTGTMIGALASTGTNGEIVYSEASLQKVKGFLCPEVARLNAKYQALEAFYVKS